MPITEFAILTLHPPLTPSSPRLHALLLRAKSAMQTYTANPTGFHYYTCLESPSHVYILGEWASLAQHMDGFIPSAENQALLKLLGPLVAISTFFHVDVPGGDIPVDALVLAVERMRVRGVEEGNFSKEFGQGRRLLEGAAAGVRIGAGWRIEKEVAEVSGVDMEMLEWVVFSGWASREEHHAFGWTAGGKEYNNVREWVDEADLKHLVRLEVDEAETGVS